MLSISVMDAGSLWRENGKSKDWFSRWLREDVKILLGYSIFLGEGTSLEGGMIYLECVLFSNREACNWLVTEL